MKRVEGWETRLIIYLGERQNMPFRWGWHDCCTFACSGLEVQGIKNPMKGLRKYKTARGAASAIRRLGDSLDIVAPMLAAKVGLHEVYPAFAGRGCPVLANIETPESNVELALGLIGMDGSIALFAGIDRLISMPLTKCHKAWQFS